VNKITSLEEEEKLQLFYKSFASSPNSTVLVKYEQGKPKMLYVSPSFTKLYGYTEKEAIGKNPNLLNSGQQDKKSYQFMWSQILDPKIGYWTGEVVNKKKNGSLVPVILTINTIFDKNHQAEYFAASHVDITERKAQEEKLQEIDRMKTEFLSVAAHQLRTPLGSIRWSLEMLLEDVKDLPKTAKETIASIYQRNKDLIELVNDLLNVTRIDQGRTSDKPEPTNIANVIRQACQEMAPLAEERKVSLIQKLGADQIEANLDQTRLKQIILNLLSNAIKYNHLQGEVEIGLDKEEHNFRVVVKDNGIGIPERDQKNIFDKFYRADNARKSITEGSGLGLFVVKQYVEAWGGKTSFSSKEGKGSNFVIHIPLKPKKNTLNQNLSSQSKSIKW